MYANVLFIDHTHIASRLAEKIAAGFVPPGVNLQSAGYAPINFSQMQLVLLKGLKIECKDIVSFDDIVNIKYDLVITISSDNSLGKLIFAGVPPVIHWRIPEMEDYSIDNYNTVSSTLTEDIRNLFTHGFFNAFLQQRTYLEDVFDSLNEGIIAHDLNRKIFLFSHGAEVFTGIKKEMVIGMDCHDLFKPHLCGGQCIFCDINTNYSKIPKSAFTALFNTGDGARKEFNVTRVPFRNEYEEVVGAIITIHDTTRVRELESRLGEAESFSGIIGQDHKMLEVFELIRDLAQSDYPVIITGESGTGKELVAAALHNESIRRDRLFVPVNCGALPEGTLESELFGHVKGAFTGAIRDKKGRFELADKGTLFLDEIGELSLRMQVKLLRVIQEGVFEPVGSEQTKRADVRILCATNRNLREMIATGTFREDLYYRLAVVPIEIPPLRERRNDIALLSQHFLQKNSTKLSREKMFFSEEALSCLMNYQWPGNVRQLQNAIQFALIKCRGTAILPDHLPPEIISSNLLLPSFSHTPGKAGRKPKLTTESVEHALIKAGGNKAKAARYLGVGRATLYNFMNSNKSVIEYS